LGGKPLPLLRFDDNCPVYFDRHTLSVKAGQLSMYTLDGRMRFELALKPDDETKFHRMKLQEIVLSRRRDSPFELAFSFVDVAAPDPSALQSDGPELDLAQVGASEVVPNPPVVGVGMEIPEYVMVEEAV
jgi:hypothetical protein